MLRFIIYICVCVCVCVCVCMHLCALNFTIVDLILFDKTLSGYPFLRKISVTFLISDSILLAEQTIQARKVRHLTRLIFCEVGAKLS